MARHLSDRMEGKSRVSWIDLALKSLQLSFYLFMVVEDAVIRSLYKAGSSLIRCHVDQQIIELLESLLIQDSPLVFF